MRGWLKSEVNATELGMSWDEGCLYAVADMGAATEILQLRPELGRKFWVIVAVAVSDS